MTISRLMWIAIFSIISHPLEVSDVLTDVILGDGADMTTAVTLDVDFLSDMEIVVMATPAITLEFVVGLTYAEDVPADLLADSLAAAMTPSKFTLPAP